MFESWPVVFEPPTRRVVDPPQPVLVDISVALAQAPNSFRDATPLKVRAEGLAMDIKVQGLLFGWARTGRGGWLACVDYSIPTGNGKGKLDLIHQWCPSNAITPLR